MRRQNDTKRQRSTLMPDFGAPDPYMLHLQTLYGGSDAGEGATSATSTTTRHESPRRVQVEEDDWELEWALQASLQVKQTSRSEGLDAKHAVPHAVPETERNKEKAMCAICLEAFKRNDDVQTLGCGHTFHANEVQEWFQTGHTDKCPICKRPAGETQRLNDKSRLLKQVKPLRLVKQAKRPRHAVRCA